MVNATSRPFCPRNYTRYSLQMRLVGPRGWSGRLRKISSPSDFEPRTVPPVPSSYSDWAIPAVHFFLWRCDPTRVMASSFLRFLDHTQRRTTFGRTPLDERSARRRDLYLTTHNTHNRQTSMPPVGFEPTISAGERPQTYALDRAATILSSTSLILQK